MLNLESPPFDHIVPNVEISKVNVFGPVMMLCGSSDSKGSFIVAPQRWCFMFRLNIFPELFKPGDFTGCFAGGDEFSFHGTLSRGLLFLRRPGYCSSIINCYPSKI